ncbi:polysaccharide pyruvyl transferase CsaB [Cyanobium sp. WAJ14-Wanaka]|uniref:polysaccharide pyruvyl transferase CsaB n=1 Tax=Cyanobium sp. WAJ14-Wanaka TaxID=2823725 RepID=UPI0028F45C16|nr:polysaccharide pyruvyl transferase CsaB [Cyanobium sp. WAJ14-Wanaka]
MRLEWLQFTGRDLALAPGKTFLLCGYYGEHNLGDDALLEVALSQLPQGSRAIVTAHDQTQVQERFGVATVQRRSLAQVLAALRQVDALVLGGGSLLQDSTSFKSLIYYGALIAAARMRGKQVLLWGQGLGPLGRRRSRWLVRRLLPMAAAISWRDQASADLAGSWGVTAPVAPDPVWGLAPQPWRGRGGPIVVCLRPTSLLDTAQLDGAGWLPYLEALASLAEAGNREVIWLAFHGHQDQGLLASLQQQDLLPPALGARSREVVPQQPREAMAVFAGAGLVVAMRLHGLILAALAGCPVAALSYDPKVAAAAKDLGCPCHSLADPAFPERLLESWRKALDQPLPSGQVLELHLQAQEHRKVFA